MKFSGKTRDWASFERDFLLVCVPHRLPAQVGLMFREGMPTKYKELVCNVKLDDWQVMLNKVKEEVATPRMVVDSALGDLDKMQTPKSDSQFVKFVEDM